MLLTDASLNRRALSAVEMFDKNQIVFLSKMTTWGKFSGASCVSDEKKAFENFKLVSLWETEFWSQGELTCQSFWRAEFKSD